MPDKTPAASLFKKMPFGIAITAENGDLLFINDFLKKKIGIVSKDINIFDIIDPQSKKKTLDTFKRLKRAEVKEVQKEYNLKMNGKVFWMESTSCRINCGTKKGILHIVKDITAKKKEDEHLHQANIFKHAIIENAPFGICILNGEGKIEYINKQLLIENGLTEKDYSSLIGQNIMKENGPFNKDFVKKLKECLRGKAFKENDTAYKSLLNDKERIANIIGIPLKEYGGKKISLILEDITEQKKYQENILSAKQKAEEYLNIAGNIIVALDANGKITILNKKGHEVLGYKEGELVGRDWFECCIPPEKQEEVRNVFKKSMKGEASLIEHYENPILTQNGEKRIINWHNTLLENKKKQIIGTLSSGLDVSQRVKAESKLRQSEERYKQFFTQLPLMAYNISLDGKILNCNEAVLRTLGYKKKEELIGKPLLTTIYTPRSRKNAQRLLEEWKKNGKIKDKELQITTKTGKILDVILNADMIYDEKGNPLFSISTHLDITEKKKAEQALKERTEKLERFNKLAVGRELKMIELKKKIRTLQTRSKK